MEELLNKLIEKGYCPRGVKDVNIIIYNWIIKVEYRGTYQMYHIRELVSKESWLWQFCVENKLYSALQEWVSLREKDFIDTYRWEKSRDKRFDNTKYEYRLIESALKDESELEQFLLDNIKIWNYEN